MRDTAVQRPAQADNPSEETSGREALGTTLEFMRLLWAVDSGLQRRSKRMETEIGVTGMQRLVLRLLGRFPASTPSRIAELLHVHRSTLTGVLQRLESHGLIARLPNEADGRSALLALTEAGAQVNLRQAGTVEAAVRRALQRLPDEKLLVSAEVLTLVAEELGRADR